MNTFSHFHLVAFDLFPRFAMRSVVVPLIPWIRFSFFAEFNSFGAFSAMISALHKSRIFNEEKARWKKVFWSSSSSLWESDCIRFSHFAWLFVWREILDSGLVLLINSVANSQWKVLIGSSQKSWTKKEELHRRQFPFVAKRTKQRGKLFHAFSFLRLLALPKEYQKVVRPFTQRALSVTWTDWLTWHGRIHRARAGKSFLLLLLPRRSACWVRT